MCDKPYVNLPVVDFDGGAGSSNPLNRETRYKPYVEKLRQREENADEAKNA